MSSAADRVTFVADEATLGPAVPSWPAGGMTPSFVDLRPGHRPAEVRAAVDATRPAVVVAIGPPFPDGDALSGAAGLVLAFALEEEAAPWADRVVAAHDGPAWRHAPLPVDDALFAPVAPAAAPPRILFLGRSTAHRELVLSKVKHAFDVLHVADGVRGPELAALLRRTDVGLNAHREPAGEATPFEHRVALHLAAGHLLLSEPLRPSHGLEAGIDFLAVRDGTDLHRVVAALRRHPQMAQRIRVRGRAKAEAFRASRVWPRLIADARRDVAAFGRADRAS